MYNMQERVRIAIQKSGRLSEDSFNLLKRCGIHLRPRKEQLFCHSDNFPLDILCVRDDDIPNLVMDGICDFAIVGTNVLEETSLQRLEHGLNNNIKIVNYLDFGRCRLSIAMPQQAEYVGLTSLNNCRIATSYPYLLANFLRKSNLSAKICNLSGSVEIAPRLGIADGICDLVSTGATLQENNLQEVEVVFASQAVLIKSTQQFSDSKQRTAEIFENRIQGAKQAYGSKYIMLHAPKSEVDQIVSLLPGAEHPTIMPLQGDIDKVAIHALCLENIFWETLEQLKHAGANSILVLPVEKILA